ncbi:MAG: aldo/keto reductase [Candidatus Latescibacterota bacterium]|nr:aldo/keto reductase [Candidatus Latescibacterota bacterium]
MEYRQLGKSGVKVSEICLGTAFRGQKDDKICEQTIHRALELGCNFLDCANFYGRGRSETIVGKALKDVREDVVLTSKVWSRMGDGPNDSGLSRFSIMREIERSLERLQTDHVDVYLLHNIDSDTPTDEILQAMDDAVRQGKATYVGSCNHTPWRLMEHIGKCDAQGLAPMVVTQNPYSLLRRYEVEGELTEVIEKYGLGLMTYSPLAVGLLSGLFRKGQPAPEGTPWTGGRMDLEATMTEQVDKIIQLLLQIGYEVGKTPAQVAIAWILDHAQVTAPIIGPDSPNHVDDVFGGIGWKLASEHRTALDQASDVSLKNFLA